MRKKEQKIGKIIYGWLSVLVLGAFALAAVAGLLLQNYFQERQSFTLLREYIEDFEAKWDFNAYMKWYMTQDWGFETAVNEKTSYHFQDNDYLKRLAEPNANWVTDISIVDDKGIVTHSSDPDMVGYDLHDSEYMSEFLCILDGEDYYARDFYPDPFETDPDLKKVYGAVSIQNYDGLVLYGFNQQALENLMNNDLWDSVTENRIGKTGFLIACNKDKVMVGITAAAMNEKLQEDIPYDGEVELPETEDEITESITDFYGEKCYVSAVKKPGYYLIAAYPLKEANALRETFNMIFVITLLIVLAVLFVVLYFLLKNHVVREVGSIHGSLKKITAGDLEEKAEADGSLEFYELSTGINDMVSNLKDRIRAAKEQMAEDLEKARRIQEAAVPKVFPENDAFGLYASMFTAESVGGDFYDFFMTDKNTLAFVMADVCGKGMPAALYMMRAKALIKTCAEQGMPVDEVARTVNRTLCENASQNMFVTAWLGFLDLRTGRLSYVHAGHTLPVHVGKEISFVKQKINVMLGGLKRASYQKQEMTLRAGESIFIYTDGVTEAQNMEEEQYGENRLLELFMEKKDALSSLSGNALCKAGCEMVYESVTEFMGDAPQHDDITMMWVTYNAAADDTPPLRYTLREDAQKSGPEYVSKADPDSAPPLAEARPEGGAGRRLKPHYRKQKLGTITVIWLAVIMVIAAGVSSATSLLLQNYYQKQQAFSVISDCLEKNIEMTDLGEPINQYFDEWMNDIIDPVGNSRKDEYSDNDSLTRVSKTNKLYLNEISIVDQNGIIAYSSNPDLIGADIRDNERTAPFVCLLEGETSYSDSFASSPFHGSVKEAYAGRTFRDKRGFVLWGIDEDNYRNFCLATITDTTEDAKIGMTGYLINCDLDKNITCVTYTMADTAGERFTEISVLPEEEGKIKETVCNLYGKECYVGAVKMPDYYVIGAYPVAEADQFKQQNNVLFAALFFLVLIVFFIALFIMLKRIVIRGVEKTHASLGRITGGDLEEKVDVRGSVEFVELSSDINDTVDKLKDLIREEEERVKNELLTAKYIQESAVPKNLPPYTDNESFRLFASMNTAKDVGGDFYDFFMVDENTLAIVMADVCGKGLPAALFMMSSDILLHNCTLLKKNPKAALEEVNRQICADNSAGMFVTIWLGILDLETGKLTAVNAGHEKPAIKSPEGSFELFKDKHGLMAGYFDNIKYPEYELQLEKGSKLFLYTDGVAEATNSEGKMFGTGRMIEALRSAEEGSPEEILQAVDLAVSDFVKDAAQSDDITMLCLEYKGSGRPQ